MKKGLILTAVFLVGAIVMIYELVGARIMAPYFGNAIFVWSNIIGVILGSLSLGYYLGGKYSELNPDKRKLSLLILISALLLIIMIVVKDFILGAFSQSFDIITGSFLTSLILFSPISIIWGMITPYGTKLLLLENKKAGETVGSVYAISTLGSIFGTFGAGLFLIPTIGSNNILYLLVVLLLIAASILFIKNVFISGLILFFLVLGFATREKGNKLLDVDTLYSRIIVTKEKDPNSEREIIALRQDKLGIQSAVFTDSDEIALPYLKYFDLHKLFVPKVNQALMIGGAAYAYPNHFLAQNSGDITVVEIDPRVTQVAKTFFNLKENKRLKIIHEDGRMFLNKNQTKYDFIAIDAFTGASPPFHLATKEAVEAIEKSLNKDGVVITNFIGSLGGRYFNSQYHNYKYYFEHVYLFALRVNNPKTLQNIILVATDRPIQESKEKYLSDLLKRKVDFEASSEEFFTDNFAPVEFFSLAN